MKLILGACAVGVALFIGGASGARADSGQAVYEAHCAMCHDAMDPKLGDKDAWAPRIKLGTPALVAAATNGKGVMPAQGGPSGLSDADITAAVQYMVSKAQ